MAHIAPQDFEPLRAGGRSARQAGATTVIKPVRFASLLLVGSTDGHHIADST